jgi:hypothetical protein
VAQGSVSYPLSFAKISLAPNAACIASITFQLLLLNRIRSFAALPSFSVIAASQLSFSQ